MVSNLIDNYPDQFAVVEYHTNGACETPWGTARENFYNIWASGTPWFAYDGLFDAWPINTYQSKLNQRLAIPTPVTMSVECAVLEDQTHRITLEACVEPGGSALDLRLYAVVVEDHTPSSPSYYRNCFRDAAFVVDVTIQPGECHTEVQEFDMDPSWDPADLKIIAWAQAPYAAYPAEIYQGAKALAPFPDAFIPGDLDLDGDVDLSDLATLLSNYGAVGGVQYKDGDIDGDGDVDLSDLAELLAHYGESV